MAQHPMKVVLLDLDGTLTKSDGGIIASVVKTFEELGRPVPDDAELHRFIGPAIIESLRRNHVPEDELDRAVTIYRSYYADRAVFDDPNEPGNKVPGRLVNVVFPGIREQLLKLRADGYYLALASCKPEYQCVPICEHFHLTELLDGIYGASRDNSRLDKDQVIRYCFDKIGFDAAAGDKAVMIGDRYTDIDGAHACNLDAIGCRWGYAPAGEMEEHGAYEARADRRSRKPLFPNTLKHNGEDFFMMGCDGACAAGFDLVFIGLPLLSLYEIPMLIWFIWRAFHWKRDDKDWLKGTAILAIAVVAPVLLWLSAWYAPVLLWLSALVCVD